MFLSASPAVNDFYINKHTLKSGGMFLQCRNCTSKVTPALILEKVCFFYLKKIFLAGF